MSVMKERAQEILNELHQGGKLEYLLYSDLMDAVQEIEPLRDRDEELEEMWSLFADVPVNPETECIEEPFAGWGAGISREEIWHWFDERYSKGVYALMYGGNGVLDERLKAAEEVIGSAYGAGGEYVDQLISRYWEKYCLKGRK